MFSSQHYTRETYASSHHLQDRAYQSDHSDTLLDGHYELEEPATPRAIRTPGQEQQPQQAKKQQRSGSETERESVRRSKRQNKGKGKDKTPADTPTQPSTMLAKPTRATRRSSGKPKKNDDWSEVTDPEERRRIQNRIAQRKFREKAREQRERAERESRNQDHAASSYQVPSPEDFGFDDHATGTPWGGPSFRYMVNKGYESMSNSGSGGPGSNNGSISGSNSVITTGTYLGAGVAGATAASAPMPKYFFDDTTTTDLYRPASAGLTPLSVPASLDGTTDTSTRGVYYYPNPETSVPYAYGGTASSRSSSSDYTYAGMPPDEQYYDDGSFYHDYES